MEKSPGCRRRSFLCGLAAVGAMLVPAVTGLIAFLNPLRLKGAAGRFVRLTMLDALPDDGTPQRVAVVAERTDGWTRFPPEPIGAVFLRRSGDKVSALQVICPHAGCSIGYQDTPEEGRFSCPCHQATFTLDGVRAEADSFSPRDMDSLEVEVRNGDEVWVNYQTFVIGTAGKIPQG